MNQRTKLSVIVLVLVVTGFSVLAWNAHPFGAASADERVQDQASIRSRAEQFASEYLTQTFGDISLEQMELVDIRYEPDVTEIATSATSGFYSSDPQNVWILAWERGGVWNVTTGQNDGTASLVLVLRNGTAEVVSATARIRQPAEQERARGPLPEYRELFGPPPFAIDPD